MIAALFVEKGGCYYGLAGVDPWDITRDARTYPGPHPVVAHPPCERWGRFSTGSPLKKTYRTGADDGCFASALDSLKAFGGILEHPAHSKAWEAFGIKEPAKCGWTWDDNHGIWVCQVEQGHYGHCARKPTWLLVRGELPPELRWGPAPQRIPQKRLEERGRASAVRCGMVAYQSRLQRQRTPPAFRDLLIEIAQTVAQAVA